VLQPQPLPPTGPALLIDGLLRAAAVVVAISFVVLLSAREDAADTAHAIAAVLCLALAVSVLAVGLWSSNRDWRVILLSAVASLCSLASLWRRRAAWAALRHPSRQAALGVVAVAAVPAFTFWQETSFLPARSNVSLSNTIEVTASAVADDAPHLLVTLTLANPSEVRAHVIISDLTICHWADERDRDLHAQSESARARSCVAVLNPFNERSWLDPGVEWMYRTSVPLPPGRPFLEARLRAAYARADRVVEVFGSERSARPDELGPCPSATVIDLQAPSRLNSLALRERAIMYGELPCDGGRAYWFGNRDDMRCAAQDRFVGLQQYYSATAQTTQWVDWPAVPPTDPQAD
jgi:hypothetical protein